MCKEHPQAAILRALADGEKQFQWCETNGMSAWTDVASVYVLGYLENPAYKFRVKKDCIMVNGVECPAPRDSLSAAHAVDIYIPWGYRDNQDNRSRRMFFATAADARQVFDALVLPFRRCDAGG